MRNRRQVRQLVVGIAVSVATMFAGSGTASAVAGFGDVAGGRFYSEAVQWMVDNDITTGTSPTCFSPNDTVTRGQAAAFLWRIEGFPTGAPPHPFDDIVAVWQQEPVSWMYHEGITTGTSPTTYAPNDTLTRGQMAALLWRAAGRPDAAPTTFPDVTRSWQLVPVGWMEAEDITTGTSPTMFSPDDPVTRGQFATFAWRWKGEPSVVVDGYSPLCDGIDHFDGAVQAGWTVYDNKGSHYSLSDVPGSVAIGGSNLSSVTLDRGPVATNYLIETRVQHSPGGSFAPAGLQSGNGPDFVTLFLDHCTLSGCSSDAIYLDSHVDSEFVEGIYYPLPAGVGEVYLSLRYINGLWVGAFSLDGAIWEEVGRLDNRIDDATYGVWACCAENDPAPIALFDWFKETAI